MPTQTNGTPTQDRPSSSIQADVGADGGADAPLADRLRAHLEAGLEAHLALLERMVATNSFSANPEGVDAVGRLTAEAFAPLGFSAELVASGRAEFGHHLVLRRPAETAGAERRVVFVSHLDTVFSADEETRNGFGWRVEGARIYGPGTVDIKGGTVVARMVLEALRDCAPDVFARIAWVVALDAAEERMEHAFGPLLRGLLGAGTLACLVFESARLDDGALRLVTARKGMAQMRIAVAGASTHAGNAHHQGANAIVQLARVIERVAGITDPARDLTLNVGTVRGGTVRNRVPHEAEAALEIRAFDPTVLDEAVAAVMAHDGPGDVVSRDGNARCHVHVTLEAVQAAWPPNPATERIYAAFAAAAASLGLRAEREERGGLSDSNRTWDLAPTLDGLGPAGGNMHASEHDPASGREQEFVEPASMVPKALVTALALVELIEGLGEGDG